MAFTQLGQTVLVGYGTFAYSVVVLQSVSHGKEADEKVIKSGGATTTVLISDPRQVTTFKGIIIGSTPIAPPAVGETIALGTFTGRVTGKPTIDFQDEEAVLSVDAIKEDSMTYI